MNAATNRYLQRDALATYQADRYDEALIILQTLYDRDRNYSGLAGAVTSVSNRLIRQHLEQKDYAAARHVLELLDRVFPRLELANVATWQKQFEEAAGRQIDAARTALEQKQYSEARVALRHATDIMPSAPGAKELLAQLAREYPEVTVGVARHAPAELASPMVDWASARVSRLVNPSFVQLNHFGAEGGQYRCPWAHLEIDDTGLDLSLRLTPKAVEQGITPGHVVMRLLSLAGRGTADYQEDFAELLDYVAIDQGEDVRIHLKRLYVRPEALLRFPIHSLSALQASGVGYQPVKAGEDEQDPSVVRYERQGADTTGQEGPRSIVERRLDDDRAAMQALVTGQVDLLDRIPPWQIEKLRDRENVVVGHYQLPTVHVLLLDYSNPILQRREFRRALCYGINRENLVTDILVAGQPLQGFRPLSGPLPAGASRSDPVGYGYNHTVTPRPYEPRLAAVLATVARIAVEKQKEAKEAAKGEKPKEKPAEDAEDAEDSGDSKPDKSPVVPLVLMYPAEPVARTVCQTLKLQLDGIGIPVELKEQPLDRPPTPDDYDLLYTELSIQEPVVDARRLLGPGGIAGICSTSMSLALDELDHAENWKQVQDRLHEVHQTAYYDLPVIPLWQTYNYYAHLQSVRGFGASPISCYQNVDQWRRVLLGGGQ